MRNYRLFKARLFKTGLVLGTNKHGRVWIELWLSGKVYPLTLRHTDLAIMRREDKKLKNLHRELFPELYSISQQTV